MGNRAKESTTPKISIKETNFQKKEEEQMEEEQKETEHKYSGAKLKGIIGIICCFCCCACVSAGDGNGELVYKYKYTWCTQCVLFSFRKFRVCTHFTFVFRFDSIDCFHLLNNAKRISMIKINGFVCVSHSLATSKISNLW